MSLTRPSFNITGLLAICFMVFLYLPLGEHGTTHAHNKKNTEELDTLIQSITNTIKMLEESIVFTTAEVERNRDRISKQLDTESQTSESIDSKILLIEEAVNTIKTAVSELKQNTLQHQNGIQSTTDQLKTVDQNIKRIFNTIDEKQLSISKNAKVIKEIRDEMEKLYRSVRTNSTDASTQKSLIEDNSTRIYEVLIDLVRTKQEIEKINNNVAKSQNRGHSETRQKAPDNSNGEIQKLWDILNIMMIFFIPLAFSHAYTGKNKLRDGVSIDDGLILVIFGSFLGYLFVGFGLMYGTTVGGVFGSTSPLFEILVNDSEISIQAKFAEFILFQVGTVILASLIIYSAVGTQISSVNHFTLAFIAGAVFIPIFGHWTLSERFEVGNAGWLQEYGFKDEAGTIVFNVLAAWFAMTVLYKLRKTKPNDFSYSDISVYSSSTIVLLFIGWMGFTTGHLPIDDKNITVIILNVSVAAVSASVVSLIQRLIFSKEKNRITYALGGFVSGLVAIAACAQSVTLLESLVVGAIAGSVHNLGFSFLTNTVFKNPWQRRGAHLIAIHGISGVWGVMCIGILGSEGNFGIPSPVILMTQLQIIGISIVYGIIGGGVASILVSGGKNENEEKPVEAKA